MKNEPLNNHSFPVKVPKRVGKAYTRLKTPWLLLLLLLALYVVAGVLLSVFSPPDWIWILAFGGTFLQGAFLAGPRALSSLTGRGVVLSRAVTCLGTALLVVGLAIAVGFGGTNDIDQIKIAGTGLALFFINVGILLLAAMCGLLMADVGDRLLADMGRTRCSLYILSSCFLGLLMGGALGLAIAS